jgi:hypothetical protein
MWLWQRSHTPVQAVLRRDENTPTFAEIEAEQI